MEPLKNVEKKGKETVELLRTLERVKNIIDKYKLPLFADSSRFDFLE